MAAAKKAAEEAAAKKLQEEKEAAEAAAKKPVKSRFSIIVNKGTTTDVAEKKLIDFKLSD